MADPHVETAPEARAASEGKASKAARPEPVSFRSETTNETPPSAAFAGARDLLATSRSLAASRRDAALTGADLWLRSFEPFYAFHNSLMGWFDEVWRDAINGLYPAEPSRAFSAAPFMGLPPADIRETPEAYVVCVEAPGLTEADVNVAIDGDMLSVRGCKNHEREEAAGTYRLSERRFGRFERSFRLPPGLARDRMETQLRDGVLKISLPRERGKPAEAAPTTVRH